MRKGKRMWELLRDDEGIKPILFLLLILALITITYIKFGYHDYDKLAEDTTEAVYCVETETEDTLTELILAYEPTASLLMYETEPIIEVTAPDEQRTDLEGFTITYYCGCEKCCGKWAQYHLTSSGTTPEAGRTIATDTMIIPYGTIVEIFGHEYIAEDTGSSIIGNHIDIYVDDHDEALQLGLKTDVTVTIIQRGGMINAYR